MYCNLDKKTVYDSLIKVNQVLPTGNSNKISSLSSESHFITFSIYGTDET
jgi:hypothetical protein